MSNLKLEENCMKKVKPKIKTDKMGQFFCTGCGKAGFATISHGHGHLGVCRGLSEISEALGPTHASSSPSPYPLGGSPLSFHSQIQKAAAAMTGVAAPAVAVADDFFRVHINHLEEKIDRLEKVATNHIPHLSGQMNGVSDFFEAPMFKWALVALAVVAIFYIVEKGDSKTKQSMGNKILDFAIKKI
jgi:hypothetical protein